jgi:hypothetical protein
MTVTNQNCIHEEVKSRLHSGNACYNSIENLLSSCTLSKNLKIKIYKTVILPVVLCGCETWSLMLRKEHRLRVFKENILTYEGGSNRGLEKLHNVELHNCIPHQILSQ